MFLYVRMIVYVLAVPVAAYLGGTYDPITKDLTINIDSALDILMGLGVALGTFGAGRVAKSRGGAT